MGLIRFALALSVVFWHMPGAPFHLMNASVAVTLFFIISGFYMAMVINEKYAKGEPEHWIRTFYLARLWRLYPPYLAMFLTMMIWGATAGLSSPLLERLPMSVFDQVILAASNIFLFGQDIHQFLVRVRVESAGPPFFLDIVNGINPATLQNSNMAVGQAWSLALEATFYLVAPFVVRSSRRTAIWLLIALVLRFLLLEVFGQRSGIWGYFFFPGAVCMFLLGSAAYHFRKLLPLSEIHVVVVGWIALACFMIWFTATSIVNGVVLPSAANWSIDRPRFWILYVLFAVSIPFIFEATKRVRFDRELGELSYPIYLVHGLVLGFVYIRWAGPRGLVPDAWAAVTFVILAAFAMRQLVEIPIEKYRSRLQSANLRLRPA
jgi:peptidoglycan/LPS O-acetylase OafA/YrhL